MTLKKIKRSSRYRKAVKRGGASEFDFSAIFDEYDPVINQRIAEYVALKATYDAEDAAGHVPKRSRTKGTTTTRSSKRKVVAIQSDDDDSDAESDFSDLDHISPGGPPKRSSPRKRPRIDYSVDNNSPTTRGRLPSLPSLPPLSGDDIYPGFAPHQRYSISQMFAPAPLNPEEPVATAEEMEALMKAYLERRKSSTLSNGPTKRKASFLMQPVSESRAFESDDPPSCVGDGADSPLHSRSSRVSDAGRRRSARLASKSE